MNRLRGCLIRLWLLVLILMLLGAAGTAAVLESADREMHPPSIALLLPDANCKPPCWNGIRPGVTTGKEANLLLAAAGDWSKSTGGYWQQTLQGSTYRLTIEQDSLRLLPEDVQLADILLAFGEPDYQTLNYIFDAREASTVLYLYYQAEQVQVEIPIKGDVERLTPDLPVRSLIYKSFKPPTTAQVWQGFGWLYVGSDAIGY